VDLRHYRVEQPSRSVPRETREPQAGPASCLSNSASKLLIASGDGVCLSEPNTERSATGEGLESLPGSKSVARAEGDARNRGGPELSRRTNCASQAGMPFQRQGEVAEAVRGVGSARSRSWQGVGPEMAQGADLPAGDRQRVRLKSPVRENRPPGSVRGAPGNRRPYLDKVEMGRGGLKSNVREAKGGKC
jgi:hypothetical protein